jgi:aryl-alcohol dehydrogenase-like predicted oxidoreductase
MDYARLGSTGLKVSRICLGMMSYSSKPWREWTLDYEAAEPIVRRAVDLGVNFFDTADMYSTGASEEVTGKLLDTLFARRDDYVLATKVFNAMGDGPNDRGLSRKHIMASIDDSLRRLGTDHTPIEETMQALHDVVQAGKARYIGASSMWAWQFAKAQHVAATNGWTRFVSMQNHYNLMYREEEREMLPLCLDQGVGVIPWSPLARGLLARAGKGGTTRAGSDTFLKQLYQESDVAVAEAVAEVAERRGVPSAQVALAWLLRQPAVTAPIVGATKLAHIEDAGAAAELELTAEEAAAVEAPYAPHEIAGHA